MFDNAMVAPPPPPPPPIITRDLHFCNLHTEISLHANFQPDANILKFSMMSPVPPAPNLAPPPHYHSGHQGWGGGDIWYLVPPQRLL